MFQRLLVTITALLAVVVVEAQEHITFMGLPVDGSIRKFSVQMKRLGFKRVAQDKKVGTWMFSGQFTGQESDVCVVFDRTTKVVNCVMVYLPDQNAQEALSRMESYDRMLAEKYPNAIRTVKGLGHEAHIEYGMDHGIVSLWKMPTPTGHYRVSITYFDKLNNTKRRTSLLNDL